MWIGFFLVGLSQTDHFHGNDHKAVNFLFSQASKFEASIARLPYDRLLTKLARWNLLENLGGV